MTIQLPYFGSYKVRLINTSTLKGYESEFDIVGDTCLENTLVLKYSNTRNMYDTVFVSSDVIKDDVNIQLKCTNIIFRIKD